MTTTLTTATHTAALDNLTGYGLLACPHAHQDVDSPERLSESLHEADYAVMLDRLSQHGWTLMLDDDDAWTEEGATEDGRMVLALRDTNPLHQHVDLDQLVEAREMLLADL